MKLTLLIAFLFLGACQSSEPSVSSAQIINSPESAQEKQTNEQEVRESILHSVGGVIVKQSSFIILREKVSDRLRFVFPNAETGQSAFNFQGKPANGLYDIEILTSGDQACSIENGSGTYEDFPVFSVRILCEDEDGIRWSGNPIIRDAYSADPTLLPVGDTLYLYAGRDEASFFHANQAFCKDQCPQELAQLMEFDITGIHIYKTKNMVDWEYVGPAIVAAETDWMQQTWASHIIQKNNKYYLYTSSPVRGGIILDVAVQTIFNFLRGDFSIATGPTAEVGVAVSDSPEGPFTDLGPIVRQGDDNAGISIMDPAAYIDSDDQGYLFYGGGGVVKYVQLNDDLISIKGEIKDVLLEDGSPMPGFTEGPYVHKHNDLYYFTYSTSAVGEAPGPLSYATSNSINGPWTYKGDFLGEVGILTNHGGITRFKDQDYLFYHTGKLPGTSFLGFSSFSTRAVSVEKLYYADNGDIELVEQTATGVPEI